MTYAAHPYASASSSSIKSRPIRPTITTPNSATSFFEATSPICSAKLSPSPIVFARASVISPLHEISDGEREKRKKDRRRGLMGGERVAHAGLDALLNSREAAPRRAPQPVAPQLTRSLTSTSVVPTIECIQPPVESETGHESDASGSSTSTPRASSPTPSSGSASAPSTPGQPRTPESSEFEVDFSYPAVAPLSIAKPNRSPSPAPQAQLHATRAPSPACKAKKDAAPVRRKSRGRFSARNASLARADSLFAPLELNTDAAQALDLSLESPSKQPTLTSVLAEFELGDFPPVPTTFPPAASPAKEAEAEDDESEWLDVEEDPLGDAEYYRADIASHLQLFSPSYSFPPTTSVPRHRRGGSSSSSSHWQLPPARPDSLPPPPRFLSSRSSIPSLPPLPALPPLPLPTLPGSTHHADLRRASASSLASTASGRSTRSSGSASGKSKRRSGKGSRGSLARRSAAMGVGRKRSAGVMKMNINRPLPPIPGAAKKEEALRVGPSALLDPTFMELEQGQELEMLVDEEESMVSARPPPRFSIPMSVDEDVFGEDIMAIDERMDELAEEDEDEDGLLDPFVFGGSVFEGGVSNEVEVVEEVDPFSFPVRSARTDFPLSPSSLAPSTYSPLSPPPTSFSQSQTTPFLLAPHSPTPSSIPSTSSNDTFDAESLYSSYAAFTSGAEGNTTRKNSANSVDCDGSGRPLQSRWSVSTFASTAPPPSSASSSRSFFPKLANVPSRLSARLKAARERSLQQAREREEKEAAKPPVVRPYPFFPTPTPPSPKRKTNPGPGKYVPKPELMPPAQQQKAREAAGRTSPSTCSSPRSSSETVNISSLSPKSKGKGKESDSTSFIAQFAQYRAHKHSAAPSPSPYASSLASPPLSSGSSARSSTDSLSAFPFTLGGDRLCGAGSSASGSDDETGPTSRVRRQNSGLRRKAIPDGIFSRA